MIRKVKALFYNVKKAEVHENEAIDDVDQSTSVEQKIKAIMASVFKIDVNEITEDTSADNIAQWTSLEHVDFTLNLQKEFDKYLVIPENERNYLEEVEKLNDYVITESEGFFERMLGGIKSIGKKIEPEISKDEDKI